MPAAILARLCLVEARRGGLPWLALASLLAAVSLAAFLSEAAISESRSLQLSVLAATCTATRKTAAALFFAMTLAQLVPAIAATAGLYLLARSIAAIQAIAAGPLAPDSLITRLAGLAVDGVALLLPRLDVVTRTEWLLYAPPSASAYALALGGLALYGVLLVAAGLFDFHRRNF